ncbi:hypothetical protein D3C71_1691820 [compost metagenome]
MIGADGQRRFVTLDDRTRTTQGRSLHALDVELEQANPARHHSVQRHTLNERGDAGRNRTAQLAGNVIRQLGLIGGSAWYFVQPHVEQPDIGPIRETLERLVVGRQFRFKQPSLLDRPKMPFQAMQSIASRRTGIDKTQCVFRAYECLVEILFIPR